MLTPKRRALKSSYSWPSRLILRLLLDRAYVRGLRSKRCGLPNPAVRSYVVDRPAPRCGQDAVAARPITGYKVAVTLYVTFPLEATPVDGYLQVRTRKPSPPRVGWQLEEGIFAGSPVAQMSRPLCNCFGRGPRPDLVTLACDSGLKYFEYGLWLQS